MKSDGDTVGGILVGGVLTTLAVVFHPIGLFLLFPVVFGAVGGYFAGGSKSDRTIAGALSAVVGVVIGVVLLGFFLSFGPFAAGSFEVAVFSPLYVLEGAAGGYLSD